MDKINIKGLEIFAHHGVYREETVLGQKFIVDVSMLHYNKVALSAEMSKSNTFNTQKKLEGLFYVHIRN